jgi:4-cresol dehydrogenase (hydroxylating)
MSTNTNHTGIWSELGQLIGHNNVITNDQEIDKRSLDLIPNTKKPGAFAYPDNIDQVMALTRWANTHSIPLWPVSTGKNWGYGAATPAIEGALVVSLEKLNRILTVDADLGYLAAAGLGSF